MVRSGRGLRRAGLALSACSGGPAGLVIENALILDGAGNPGVPGAVRIVGGRIAAAGPGAVPLSGDEVLDAQFVRERGILSLEEAVRRMTSLAAAHMGFSGRGRIAPGMAADLVLFDPETVGGRATPEDPHALSTGIQRVLVAGETVFADGRATAARPRVFLAR